MWGRFYHPSSQAALLLLSLAGGRCQQGGGETVQMPWWEGIGDGEGCGAASGSSSAGAGGAQLSERTARVDTLCCSQAGQHCSGGRPDSCENRGCADEFLRYWSN
jgi:hypothetical protein